MRQIHSRKSTNRRLGGGGAHRRPGPGRWRTVTAVTACAAVAALLGTSVAASAAVGRAGVAKAGPATVSLFGSTVPSVTAEPDANEVELGLRFSADTPGQVLGVKFYKSTRNKGTHTGSLWDSSGRRLATATFTGESSSGWQTVQFDKAVTITAGTSYVASYHAPSGYYAQAAGAFSSGRAIAANGLRATAGLYKYGKAAFPTQSWNGSHYYVDVLFQSSGTASSTPSPTPSQTVKPSPTPSQTVKPSPTPSQTVKPSPTPSQTVKPSPTPSQTVKPSPTPTQTVKPSPTPTSSSTSAPSGGSNCWAKPSACGFPDGTNTGVPAGVKLTPSGSITISKAGTVVEGLDITGCVTITASNVTLRNSRVTSTCTNGSIKISWSGVSGVVLDHVELNGQRKVNSPGIMGSGWTGVALNIYDTEDAIDVGNDVVVRDSYIHDMFVGPGAHVDGVQSTGTKNVRVIHNTIDARGSGTTSAMLFGADLGAMDNIVADNNLLNGGGYTVYAGADPGYDSGSISFTNNRFGRGFAYGPCSFGPSKGRTIGFTGNVWDDTNATLTCK